MSLHHVFKLIISCFFLCAFVAQAQTFNLPSTSTGTYTITFSTSTTYALIDELVGSTWQTIYGANNPGGSLTVTKSANGVYTYRMQACTAGQFGQSCTIVPGTKSITVTIGSSSSSVPAADTTSYVYDSLGRLVGVKQNGVIKEGYRYDKAGNRCAVSATEIVADTYCP